MSADLLSNEELLGLHDEAADQQPELVDEKPHRHYYKLTDEIMMGPRGLPSLKKSLHKFKFHSKKPKASMTAYDRYVSKRYDHSIHYENLTRLLHNYQIWGHEIYPKYRFKDFIHLAARTCSTPRIKDYRRDLIRTEIEDKISGKEPADSAEYRPSRPSESVDSAFTAEPAGPDDSTSGLFVGDDEELYTLAGDYTAAPVEKPPSKDDLFLQDLDRNIEAGDQTIISAEKTLDTERSLPEQPPQSQSQAQSQPPPSSPLNEGILGDILSDDDDNENSQDESEFLAKQNVAESQMFGTSTQKSQPPPTQPPADDVDEDEEAYADQMMREMGL